MKPAAMIGALLFVLAGALVGAIAGLLYDLYTVVGTIEVDSNLTAERGAIGALIGAAAAAAVAVLVRARRSRGPRRPFDLS